MMCWLHEAGRIVAKAPPTTATLRLKQVGHNFKMLCTLYCAYCASISIVLYSNLYT